MRSRREIVERIVEQAGFVMVGGDYLEDLNTQPGTCTMCNDEVWHNPEVIGKVIEKAQELGMPSMSEIALCQDCCVLIQADVTQAAPQMKVIACGDERVAKSMFKRFDAEHKRRQLATN